MINGIATGHTCGEACWKALEDVCRCACGGQNHGIMRAGVGEVPTRFRTIQGTRFELEALTMTGEWQGHYWGYSQHPLYNRTLILRPNDSQLNWIEVREYMAANGGNLPWMVWTSDRSIRGNDRSGEEYTASTYCKQLGLDTRMAVTA